MAEKISWVMILMIGLVPAGAHATAGVLLCIESDGHVSLEFASGFNCASQVEAVNGPDHAAEHLAPDDSHCVDCLDIILKGAPDADCGSFISSSGPSDLEWASIPRVELTVSVPDVNTLGQRQGVRAETASQTLAQLTGVVLLI